MNQPAPLNFAEFVSDQARERTCECGRAFQQRRLTERFMAVVEQFGSGAVAATIRDVPELYVPVHCPPCERRDLGRHARMHDFRPAQPRPNFGDRDAA